MIDEATKELLEKNRVVDNNDPWRIFRNTGLVWFINRILRLRGWSIIFYTDENSRLIAHPARVNPQAIDGYDLKGRDRLKKYTHDCLEKYFKEVDDLNKDVLTWPRSKEVDQSWFDRKNHLGCK
jgi:hypothetical protein